MSRSAKRKKRSISQPPPYRTNIHSHYTPEELSQIISTAIINAEKAKKDLNEKERTSRWNAWLQSTGFPQSWEELHGWNRVLAQARYVWRVVRISYKPREVVEGTQFLENLIMTILQMFFGTVYAILTVVSVIFILFIPLEWLLYGELRLFWVYYVLFVLLGLAIFFISRIFKLISDEICVIKDTNLLLTLFSCIVALVSLSIAILALLKG